MMPPASALGSWAMTVCLPVLRSSMATALVSRLRLSSKYSASPALLKPAMAVVSESAMGILRKSLQSPFTVAFEVHAAAVGRELHGKADLEVVIRDEAGKIRVLLHDIL